jgi:hypothetical protein
VAQSLKQQMTMKTNMPGQFPSDNWCGLPLICYNWTIMILWCMPLACGVDLHESLQLCSMPTAGLGNHLKYHFIIVSGMMHVHEKKFFSDLLLSFFYIFFSLMGWSSSFRLKWCKFKWTLGWSSSFPMRSPILHHQLAGMNRQRFGTESGSDGVNCDVQHTLNMVCWEWIRNVSKFLSGTNKHVWNESGTCGEWIWNMLGMNLEHVGYESGTCWEWIWNMSGMNLEHIGNESRTCWEWIWNMSGMNLEHVGN